MPRHSPPLLTRLFLDAAFDTHQGHPTRRAVVRLAMFGARICGMARDEPRTLRVRSCEQFPSVRHERGRFRTPSDVWQICRQRNALPDPRFYLIKVPGSRSPCLSRRKPFGGGRAFGGWQIHCTSLTRSVLLPTDSCGTEAKVRSCEHCVTEIFQAVAFAALDGLRDVRSRFVGQVTAA